jgi:hypothetical protein
MGSATHFWRILRIAIPRQASAIVLTLLAVSALLAPSANAKSDEVVHTPSGIMYVTGGVGSEATNLLKSMETDFNLKLVLASTSGAYLSDVKVTIFDASGQVVLDATSEGPLLMAKLPAGGYRVDATFGGHPESRKITVAPTTLSTVDFRWAAN